MAISVCGAVKVAAPVDGVKCIVINSSAAGARSGCAWIRLIEVSAATLSLPLNQFSCGGATRLQKRRRFLRIEPILIEQCVLLFGRNRDHLQTGLAAEHANPRQLIPMTHDDDPSVFPAFRQRGDKLN